MANRIGGFVLKENTEAIMHKSVQSLFKSIPGIILPPEIHTCNILPKVVLDKTEIQKWIENLYSPQARLEQLNVCVVEVLDDTLVVEQEVYQFDTEEETDHQVALKNIYVNITDPVKSLTDSNVEHNNTITENNEQNKLHKDLSPTNVYECAIDVFEDNLEIKDGAHQYEMMKYDQTHSDLPSEYLIVDVANQYETVQHNSEYLIVDVASEYEQEVIQRNVSLESSEAEWSEVYGCVDNMASSILDIKEEVIVLESVEDQSCSETPVRNVIVNHNSKINNCTEGCSEPNNMPLERSNRCVENFNSSQMNSGVIYEYIVDVFDYSSDASENLCHSENNSVQPQPSNMHNSNAINCMEDCAIEIKEENWIEDFKSEELDFDKMYINSSIAPEDNLETKENDYRCINQPYCDKLRLVDVSNRNPQHINNFSQSIENQLHPVIPQESAVTPHNSDIIYTFKNDTASINYCNNTELENNKENWTSNLIGSKEDAYQCNYINQQHPKASSIFNVSDDSAFANTKTIEIHSHSKKPSESEINLHESDINNSVGNVTTSIGHETPQNKKKECTICVDLSQLHTNRPYDNTVICNDTMESNKFNNIKRPIPKAAVKNLIVESIPNAVSNSDCNNLILESNKRNRYSMPTNVQNKNVLNSITTEQSKKKFKSSRKRIDNVQHVCEVCFNSYSTKTDLNTHCKIHLSCKYCKKLLLNTDDLENHENKKCTSTFIENKYSNETLRGAEKFNFQVSNHDDNAVLYDDPKSKSCSDKSFIITGKFNSHVSNHDDCTVANNCHLKLRSIDKLADVAVLNNYSTSSLLCSSRNQQVPAFPMSSPTYFSYRKNDLPQNRIVPNISYHQYVDVQYKQANPEKWTSKQDSRYMTRPQITNTINCDCLMSQKCAEMFSLGIDMGRRSVLPQTINPSVPPSFDPCYQQKFTNDHNLNFYGNSYFNRPPPPPYPSNAPSDKYNYHRLPTPYPHGPEMMVGSHGWKHRQ